MAKITIIDSTNFEYPQYKGGDEQAILPISVNSTFVTETGRVESFVYDLEGNLLNYNPNAEYSIVENGVGEDRNSADALLVYPEKEVENLGLNIGSYNVYFNFLNNELGSSITQPFSLKQISANRLELRLTTAFVEPEDLEEEVNKIFPDTITSPYYPDFYVNFGQNRLSIANNIVFDNTNNQYSVLIKLYEPLPSYAQERDALWVTTKQRDSIAYNVEFEPPEVLPTPKRNVLKGPNFSIPINNQVHSSVKLTSLEDLRNLSGLTTASKNQLDSILEEKGVEINIDYTNFNNFIHFSSAEERVNNFYYKVGLIESASNDLAAEPTVENPFTSASKALIEQRISSIIENFDGFEYWMYYSSGSYNGTDFPQPYPKTNSTSPYTLASTGSVAALNWLASGSFTGSLYDNDNPDNLTRTIPGYLLEDPSNEPYKKFVEMTGQHFDTLFTYVQDITNRYNADNRLDFGISKGLVGDALKSMGINLYTGNFTSNDLIDSLVGTRVPSTLPDGQTNVSNYVTASSDVVAVEDVNKEIYKRIYHNLPLLLRQKGSPAGLRTLITCFGIPQNPLRIQEFDINYRGTSYDLPTVGTSASISFPSESISLPPNRDGYIPNTLLSPSVRVQQNFLKSESYNRSLHYTEVGFSPSHDIDKNDLTSFDPLSSDFPDFNDFYFGEYVNYYGSKFINPASTTSDQDITWNIGAFIRYIKFFDSSLFNMIKDFTPVRSSTATGVIIKPTIKERPRQRPPQLTFENLTKSGSADVLYYDWDTEEYVYKAIGDYDARLKTGSFQHAGGTGGSLTDSNRYQFSSSNSEDWSGYDLSTPIKGLQQITSESVFTRLGYAQQVAQTGSDKVIANGKHFLIKATQDEFYNGEFTQTGQLAPIRYVNDKNYLFYPNREYYSGSGAGVIKTDNNNQNPYKKPSSNEFTGLTKGNVAGIAQFVINSNPIIYNTVSSVIYLKVSTIGDKDLLLANGNLLNFKLNGGANVTYTVGTPVSVFNSAGEYIAFEALDNPSQNDGDFIAASADITYVAAYDPQTLEIQPGPWAYNDYNPLIGNSFDPAAGLVNYAGIRKSVFFQDADYSPSASSSLSPINVGLLRTNSASKAAIPDSNYNSRWWLNSRYLGVRRSSPDFNVKIVKAVPNVSALYTTESIGYNPNIPKFDPGAPQLPEDR